MNADLRTGHFAFEALRSTYVRTKERQCPPQEKENHQNLLREITNEKMWINTPWKIHMEPTNHPFRKENDLPGLHDYVPC